MEKKVKIELPRKYTVGIEVLVPISNRNKEALDVCKTFMNTISEFIGKGNQTVSFDRVLTRGGKVKVSNPLIRSIAEMKVDGLNNAFSHYSIPFSAFLELEE